MLDRQSRRGDNARRGRRAVLAYRRGAPVVSRSVESRSGPWMVSHARVAVPTTTTTNEEERARPCLYAEVLRVAVCARERASLATWFRAAS